LRVNSLDFQKQVWYNINVRKVGKIMKGMSKESQMIDHLFEIDRKMKARDEQILGYVYVVFRERRYQVGTNYGDWSPHYEYDKEIEFITDNENKAKEMVQDFNNTFGKDDSINYYYEKWEVQHYE